MIYFYSILTLLAFYIGIRIDQYWKSVIFSPFVLSLIILVIILLIGKIPFEMYYKGNEPINDLLPLSIVALALPLYEQLRQIRRHWQIILTVTTLTSILSMGLGVGLSIIFGGTPEIVASILPKSITTAMATVIADHLGGIPSITAVSVVLAGLQGAILGYIILRKLGINDAESQGLAIGGVSHALGTVSCMNRNVEAGSYSSIALVLCGIISSVLAPIIYKLVYFFIN
ncbi:putative murein hydrolase (TIGR00659 family) [Bisgaardia hudsonensis]|uniref:Putative murein hydrolase (TIGR00659 family) n=1 Tax=Bisgaardia hudsonensis TaxID=109472 RepID=A0A4R2MYE9_9PAST|nr:CidB/LrgB family autolysis modulator [Bisgaardia hudsonensis]QLB13292.1 CidB/LrgB family autolysis modulator [Bisgaardia hudsonensis]TCP10963.1 putative murein hydrolase (TIGR00659 family) [Bisgaardia hudsonensis]